METTKSMETKSVNEMELMKASEDGRLEINFEVLAERTSPEFAEFVRKELALHIERKEVIQITGFTVESLPQSGRNSIVGSSVAWLTLLAGNFCYKFSWNLFERADHNRSTQDYTVNWIHIYEAQKFVDAFQNLGK